MSGRLASFRGPSTPSPSPVQIKQNPKGSPSARPVESTYHRKVRNSLQDLRAACYTWDDLVLTDGLKSIKSLVDARTELENQLLSVPDGQQPQSHIVSPKLEHMDDCLSDLDLVIAKLRKQFNKMTTIVENLEALVAETHKAKGWAWVHEQSMWTTWPLEKFVRSISDILHPYHRSLHLHEELVNSLRSHLVSFDAAREVIQRWVEQPWLEDDGWDARWEDLCIAEIEGWKAS